MYNGLIQCGQTLDSTFCIIRIIESCISALELILVIFTIIKRFSKECRMNFNMMALFMIVFFLIFLIAHNVTHQFKIFDYLYHFFYNVYFSIIVLKLSLKVQQKYVQSQNRHKMLRLTYIMFSLYVACIIISLIYNIVYSDIPCLFLPFLIINAIGFAFAVFFLVLGINHLKGQQQKIDENIQQNLQNNPMPRFKMWIITNCIGQLMVLIQAIIYQLNDCKFSSNNDANQIVKLIFVFISFHIGSFSTLYFFLYKPPPSISQNRLISPTYSISNNNDENRQIQMIYYQDESKKSKRMSL